MKISLYDIIGYVAFPIGAGACAGLIAYLIITFTKIDNSIWCKEHDYEPAPLGMRMVCIDADRRVVLPP
jgi:hypothetical protein